MNTKERWFIIFTLIAISTLTTFDIVTDLREGVTWWHVLVEAFVIIAAAIGVIYLLRGTFSLIHKLDDEREFSSNLKTENLRFKEQSKKYLEGLSQNIDEQLSLWTLSKSEKEVAFLLLKGFSFKEIANVRNTTEKTARTQSAAIYSKAGLANRSQLSAYFLEDLLLPNTIV